MISLLLLLVLGLALSGLFSAAEAAVFSLGEARVRALVEEGYRGSAALATLRARPERLLVLLRLGDAFCNGSPFDDINAALEEKIDWLPVAGWRHAFKSAVAGSRFLDSFSPGINLVTFQWRPSLTSQTKQRTTRQLQPRLP